MSIRVLAPVLLLAAGAALSGCGGSQAEAGDDGRVRVVASTDVWGSVAEAVGGDRVAVTSVIDEPSQDPHSYEASASTLLAVSRADLVIENGGGYDDFMTTLLSSAGSDAAVVDAVEVAGIAEGANEHVWYDLPTAQRMADTIARELTAADPAGASTYAANAAAFDAQVQQLVDAETAAAATLSGTGIAITEPVPLYLTDALGLVDRTPEAFSEAVEEGDDVSVPVLKATLDLFGSGQVAALVYNEQTTGPVTEQVEQAATDAGVAVVPVTETLPAGADYVSWMRANLDAIVQAVS